MKIITDIRCAEFSSPGHPESPGRILAALDALKSQDTLPLAWAEPLPVEDASLFLAHSPEHLQRLDIPFDLDADTPAYPQIAEHARRAVGGALQALQSARAGEMSFSLMRPPGHHATRDRAMGFCYLNSIAIAALAARAAGFQRVAVLDFDVHHGNGTEDILLDKPGCAFFSIHQHPCYPGTGLADRGWNCFNFPVPPGAPRLEYRAILEKALARLKAYQPGLVAVSAGFDAFSNDPLAEGSLEAEDFHWLGDSVRRLAVPALSILEGGYSDELPQLILAYLSGLAG
ncbi:MAG TPA: histone deacetylase [Candidatus Acidoferrum sp.]|nr:histone deacetylase [Candidatus Acidoferrum sp.]